VGKRLKGRHAHTQFRAKKRRQTQFIEQPVGSNGDSQVPDVTPIRAAAQPGTLSFYLKLLEVISAKSTTFRAL
jgi:hypothetical protein